jgi:hypothetical protein
MAAPVAATKAYDLSGNMLREDLADIIYDISPQDTVFLSGAGRGTANSTLHEWQTDALVAASASNAAIEGDDFSAVARTLPTRLKSYTQIARKDIVVTGTSQRVRLAGAREIMAYHTARAAKEIKRDMESAALNNNPSSAGTSVSPRVTAGVPNWIYEGQHYKASSQTAMTTTAPVSGFATATGGSWANSPTAYVETDLKAMLALAWSTGGEVDTILCGSTAFNKFSTFTGIATRFRDVARGMPGEITGYADVYVSPYGKHKLVLSRFAPTGTAYCLQMNMWEFAYLRPFAVNDIAKAGDSEKKMLLAEYCLVAKNPLANAKAHQVS